MRYELKVNRMELEDGLARLRKSVKKKKRPEASISFTGSSLIVSLDGVEISAAAKGSFPGVATIPGIQARNLAQILPPDDPTTIAFEGGRLYVGSLSIPCIWRQS